MGKKKPKAETPEKTPPVPVKGDVVDLPSLPGQDGRKPNSIVEARRDLVDRKYTTPTMLRVGQIETDERITAARLAWHRLNGILRDNTADPSVIVQAATKILEFSLGKPKPAEGDGSGDNVFIVNIR